MSVTLSKGIETDWALGDPWKTGGDRNWHLINAYLMDQWAHDIDTTTGLTYGYRGGVVIDADGVVTVQPDGTVALTDAATNFVERDALGAVTANTSDFTPGQFPMAEVVTASGAITTHTDRRIFAAQLPAGAATEAYVDAAIAALKDGVSASFDTLAEIATELGSLDTRVTALEGGGGSYTDEQAQDAVGAMVDDGTVGDIVFTYTDATPLLSGAIQSDVALAGNPTTTTQAVTDDSTRIATTAFVQDRIAPVQASITMSGTMTADMGSLPSKTFHLSAALNTNATLALSNMVDGACGVLEVVQDGTGGFTLTVSGGTNYVVGGTGGSDALPIATTANARTLVSWTRINGTDYWVASEAV